MQTRLNITQNGQEVQISDLNLMAQVAAQADDYTLAELFRLEPLGYLPSSKVAKAILPFAIRNSWYEPNAAQQAHATVVSAGSSGSVLVMPFRALLGTRTATGAGTANQLNWQDVRTQDNIGTNTAVGSNTNWSQVALAANSSGNPRWDLVYAIVAVDSPSSNVTRFVKNPTTKVVSQQSLSVSLNTTVSLAVVTGTPGATPTLPVAPADSASTYYFPLAYVWVPNGFTAASTVATDTIRDAAPIAPVSRTTGARSMRVATGNNDTAGTYQTASFPWTSGVRPSVFLPNSMIGGEALIVEIDTIASPPSHASGTVVDDSTDWRNRFFKSTYQIDAVVKFGNDVTYTPGTVSLPDPLGTNAAVTQLANSCASDNAIATGSSILSATTGGGSLGIYVDQTDGKLKAHITSSPAIRMFVIIEASAPFPNLI